LLGRRLLCGNSGLRQGLSTVINLNPFRRSKGDVATIRSVGDHIEAHFGEIEWVMHEKESPVVHIDIHVVRPREIEECRYLVTSGMSERAMPVPKGASDGRYAELMLALPADWPLSPEAFEDEAEYWPVRLLIGIARYPHLNKTWMYEGHSIHWSIPLAPFARNTEMTSVVLLRPRLIPEVDQVVHVSKKKRIRFWGVYPLYHEEADLKERQGSGKLDELFDLNGVTELLDPKRRTVAPLM
jgi:hypothetical protein